LSSGWLATGAIAAAIGVGMGAFAAHGLKARLTPDLLETFEVGARYHLYHALALLAVAWAAERWPGTWVTLSGWSFAIGIVVFSGSLYLLAVTGQRWLGAITPIGGLAFITGWIALAVAALRGR
jgi:uncharacterized membrane protein YgdD (TMEM256/DUF423 family)